MALVVSGTRRTTCSEAKKSSARPRISSMVSRPAEAAQMRSTTLASPKRASLAHRPVSGSTSPATTSSELSSTDLLVRRPMTAASTAAAPSRPTARPSASQRSANKVGVREWSLAGRVAREAASSARMRSAALW